jgi:hypothetical protein
MNLEFTRKRKVNEMTFDENGMLILPEDVIKEMELRRLKYFKNKKTSVFVTCSNCGFKWERHSVKEGIVRCRQCFARFRVSEIK